MPASPSFDPKDPFDPKYRAAKRKAAGEALRKAWDALEEYEGDPAMREKFAKQGFGPEEFAESRRQLRSAAEALKGELEAWRRLCEATAAQKQAEEEFMQTYVLLAHIVRQNLKDDPEMLRMFGLDGPLPPFGPDDVGSV